MQPLSQFRRRRRDAPGGIAESSYGKATLSIALAVGFGSLSFSFWYPFMPLYMLKIGARDEADALFWIAVATTVQGICRFLTGPLWGVLADRMGRKVMLLRALYMATPTTLIAAVASEPWQISIALACQGIFSGFVPASVALTSVSVPESRLSSSLGVVTGAQYLGATIGPAIGAILAALFGFRGTILVAALLPSLAATLVLFLVANDQPARERQGAPKKAQLEPFKPSAQLLLVIFLFFVVFAMTQLIRLATPIALKQISEMNVEAYTGLAFTLGGLASTLSVLVIAPRFFRAGQQKQALFTACLASAVAYVVLALASSVASFITVFVIIALLQAVMIPTINSLIAANVPRSRRGTAFGWAGSAQALAFVAGPTGAALFAHISLAVGFLVLGGILAAMSLWLLKLKEPPSEALEVSA